MAALRGQPSGKKWREHHNMVKMTDPILKNPLPTDIIIPYVYPSPKKLTKGCAKRCADILIPDRIMGSPGSGKSTVCTIPPDKLITKHY